MRNVKYSWVNATETYLLHAKSDEDRGLAKLFQVFGETSLEQFLFLNKEILFVMKGHLLYSIKLQQLEQFIKAKFILKWSDYCNSQELRSSEKSHQSQVLILVS